MSDLISREALKKELSKRLWFVSSPETDAQAIKDIINNAPVVSLVEPVCEIKVNITEEEKQKLIEELQKPHKPLILPEPEIAFERPQGEWIPVSERLPEDRDWCLGLFKEPDTDFIGIPYICDYVGEVTKGTTNEGWILRHCTDIDNASDYFRNLICVAWQPLPEPYMGGKEE